VGDLQQRTVPLTHIAGLVHEDLLGTPAQRPDAWDTWLNIIASRYRTAVGQHLYEEVSAVQPLKAGPMSVKEMVLWVAVHAPQGLWSLPLAFLRPSTLYHLRRDARRVRRTRRNACGA
jgi:hypothetical protein